MSKCFISLLLAAAMICTMAGCSTREEKQETLEKDTVPMEEVKPAAIPEEQAGPDGRNPLTGRPMDSEQENDRPIAVMLNNLKVAQPQLGISCADIIYEIPAEGGITRMVGVFQSLEDVQNLGSIRSTRPYYLEIALGHDAILVHAGGSPEAYKDMPAWGVDHMDGVRGGADAEIFWRDAQRKKQAGYEHSLLTSGEEIRNFLKGGQYRTEHSDGYTYVQNFAEDGTPANGMPAEHVTIHFSQYKKNGTFDFDASTGQYLAGQYGDAYVDGNTGEQVGFTNVLVLNTSISIIKGDSEGRQTVRLTGEGDGTYFCGGKAVPIRWSKKDRNSQFVYTNEDGSPLTLGIGTSYVGILSPKFSKISYE